MAESSHDNDDLEEILAMVNDSERNTTQADIDEYAKPFGVSIAHDYRPIEERGPEGNLEGHIGVCLGLYFYKNPFDRLEELEKVTDVGQIQRQSLNPSMTNPLIYVPKAGAYIWGVESDWIKLDDLDDKLREAAHTWEAMVTKGTDPFLDAILAEVQEVFYRR